VQLNLFRKLKNNFNAGEHTDKFLASNFLLFFRNCLWNHHLDILCMRKTFGGLMVFAFVLLSFWQAQAFGIFSYDEMPAHPFDDRFSTNWYATVRATMPASYATKGNFDFQETTNALCKESQQGNLMAQALWGFALVVLSDSPKTTDSGLQLLGGSAEKGCVPAMMNLGYLFESGKYVRRNYNEAFHWFSQAAELGNAEAQLQLGGCYSYGLGTTPDYSMAAKYYRLSAEQTNFVAMKSLGYLLMNGYGVETNEDEAKYWFMRAAKEGGNRRAMYNLGVIYSLKYPDTNAVIEAFKWMKQSADLGDALAAYELSNFYFRGWGATETNLGSYRYWRIKAALLGATDAQFFMGQAYRTGDGVPKDPETSLFWYEKAAAKNHPEALYDLALHYLEIKTNLASLQMANDLMNRAAQMGHREAQFQCAMNCFRDNFDFEGGKEWLSKAAENGWPKAEFCLFQLYYYGIPPAKDCPAYPKDKPEADKWLQRAADHGNYQAQSTLAVMLIRGLDMEQNKQEAEKLLRSAAEHAYAQAQNDLGFAILNGDISSTNPVEAAMWCKLAVTHLSDSNVLRRARVNLSNALSSLTVEQQQEVENRANNFQALPNPEIDPKIKDWQKNPDYQQEDGQFGH
jgi:TPR repeat protein